MSSSASLSGPDGVYRDGDAGKYEKSLFSSSSSKVAPEPSPPSSGGGGSNAPIRVRPAAKQAWSGSEEEPQMSDAMQSLMKPAQPAAPKAAGAADLLTGPHKGFFGKVVAKAQSADYSSMYVLHQGNARHKVVLEYVSLVDASSTADVEGAVARSLMKQKAVGGYLQFYFKRRTDVVYAAKGLGLDAAYVGDAAVKVRAQAKAKAKAKVVVKITMNDEDVHLCFGGCKDSVVPVIVLRVMQTRSASKVEFIPLDADTAKLEWRTMAGKVQGFFRTAPQPNEAASDLLKMKAQADLAVAKAELAQAKAELAQAQARQGRHGRRR